MIHVRSTFFVLAAFTAALAAPLSAGDPAAPSGPTTVHLFRRPDPVAGNLVVDAAAIAGLRSAPSGGRVIITDVALGGGRGVVDLALHRFRVTGPDAVFVLGGHAAAEDAIAFDPDRVVLLRGEVRDAPGSRVFLAVSDLGVLGSVVLGGDAARLTLVGSPGAGPGLLRGPVRFVESRGTGWLPPVALCGLDAPPEPPAPAGGGGLVGRRHLQMAVETDFEYFSLFGDLDAAGAYVLALYGAVSDVYLRDVDVAIEIVFVRLWDTPDDLFNEPDPLSAFASFWNIQMGGVGRDVAQFLTGRRNLPYGGVAYLNGLCNGNSYSVAGWVNGSYVDPLVSNPGNWDIVIVSHELGHNCGTAHTHDYGIDQCASLDVQRGSIMSYCHITSGGVANIDLRFHRLIQPHITGYMGGSSCITDDCNGNFVNDDADVASGFSADLNGNGVPDECEDCNGNGTLDTEDIGFGGSADLNGNGIPDECEPDCNENGVPDDKDIADGTSEDVYGNDIPDECEADRNRNGAADYNEIQADMGLDVDRNAMLDAFEDCNGDGTPDIDELGGGLNLWVASSSAGLVREFHGGTGAPVSASESGQVGASQDLVIGPDGRVYVTDETTNRVIVFDPASGAAPADFVAAGRGGLDDPAGLLFAPNGNLLVASRGSHAVLEYDGATGVFLGAFVSSGDGGLAAPFGLAFGPNGNLFVTSASHAVLEYDGDSGEFAGTFVTPGRGGLDTPRGIVFTPDGDLLVASFASDEVLEYDGASGGFLGRFDFGDNGAGYWGLDGPWGLRIGPREKVVYVASHEGNAAVHAYALDSGLFQRGYYVLSMDLVNPTGIDFMPATTADCNQNLRPDACDILSGASEDANHNGVPDECESCIADVDGSGDVGFGDVVALLAAWGPCPECPEDVDGDGTVGFGDLVLVLSSWGPCA